MYLYLLLLVSVGVALASPAKEPSKRQEISQLPAVDNTVNQELTLSNILDEIQNSPWWQLLQQAFKSKLAGPANEPSKRQEISQLSVVDNTVNHGQTLSNILDEIQNSPWWQLLQQAFKTKLGMPVKGQQISQLPADHTLDQGLSLSNILDQFQNSPWWQLLQQAFKPGTSNGGNTGSSPDTEGNIQTQGGSCGASTLNADVSSFIVGGTKAERGQFPWQCYLSTGTYRSFFCGCSVISESPIVVLTAAHCVNDGATENYRLYVTFGALQRKEEHSSKTIEASNVVFHKDYKSSTMANDVAVIHFNKDATLPSGASAICLSQINPDTLSGRVFVSGWGTEYSGGYVTNDLMYVEKTFKTRAECQATAYRSRDILADMVCASEEGKDSCQGDSGGPMVMKIGDHFEQVGVVSWGYGCADPDYPGVYASVQYHRQWIIDNSNL